MTVDMEHLSKWIGRAEQQHDVITPFPLVALSATLDRDDPAPEEGDAVPPAGHWLYFLPTTRQSELGIDGHAKRGGFLPPVELPRRMWAGGRIEFLRPLRVGDAAARTATVANVTHKIGKSGDLVFVVVRYDIFEPAGLAIREEHDIVYREEQRPGTEPPQAPAAPPRGKWHRTIHPDPVLLFRYSALIFNGHRIHYDWKFTTEEEGYPGLIVHGPLIATLLMDLCRRNRSHKTLRRFDYRAVSPLFDTGLFTVNGNPSDDGRTAELWAANADGGLAMQATAEFADA